ncbi:MAG TPA: hypothetical protein VK177_10060 [Flavobacteriales bacterium]|nr:hypothetical protein [Flavobacteriales bacterium]
MKFWELVSIFRSETEMLELVLSHPQWKTYYDYYNLYKRHEVTVRPNFVDEEIPFELAHRTCELSKQKFWLHYKKNPMFLQSYVPTPGHDCQELVCVTAFVRFGLTALENSLEKGTTEVRVRELMSNEVEVLRSLENPVTGFTLTLRTAPGIILQKGDLVQTTDELGKWSILGVTAPVMITSVQNYVFQNMQQNIYVYDCAYASTNQKPILGTVLTRVGKTNQ